MYAIRSYYEQGIAHERENARKQERRLSAVEVGKHAAGKLRGDDGRGIQPDEQRYGFDGCAAREQNQRQDVV